MTDTDADECEGAGNDGWTSGGRGENGGCRRIVKSDKAINQPTSMLSKYSAEVAVAEVGCGAGSGSGTFPSRHMTYLWMG